MKATLIVLVTLASLTACATVKESYAPDGRKAYSLNCSGAARGWDKCLTAAGEQCGAAGYDVLDRTGETVSSMGATGTGKNFNAFSMQDVERSMLISCKK